MVEDRSEKTIIFYNLQLLQLQLFVRAFKGFNNEEYKGKIIEYDLKNWLYEVEYEDGDKEGFYYNKNPAHWNTTTDP